jgi:type I restriction enzyme S subunit
MKALEDWKPVSIGRFVELINGFAFPSEGFTEGDGMPLIRIRDLNRRDTEVNFQGKYSERYVVKRGDLLIGMDGDFLTVKWKGNDALLNQRVCKLVTKDQDFLDQEFLFYRISAEIIKIHRITAATTVKHLSSKGVLGIEIDLPSKPEQTRIAEILSTVDQAIEQTEASIAKQCRIKTGLMQDILTRGIDEHGTLRSESSHKFKDSSLGRIPIEWEVKEFSQILAEYGGHVQTGPFGSQLHSYEYVNEGIPVVMPQDISGSGITTSNIARITEQKANSLSRHRMIPGDLVFARRGDLSRCAVIQEQHRGWLCGTGCLLMRLPARALSPRWTAETYRFNTTQVQVEVHAVGSTMANLNTGIIMGLKLSHPGIEEQIRIEDRIRAAEEYEGAIRAYVSKLRSLKAALIQDLLTGNKRVTSLLELEPKCEKMHANS